MALREFTDANGFAWKAWDVTADQIHPKTKAEDYMMDMAEGWLVFERGDGEEKRRLCPYPSGWEQSSEAELQALLGHAEKVKRRPSPASGVWKIGDKPVAAPHHDGLHSKQAPSPRQPKGQQARDAATQSDEDRAR